MNTSETIKELATALSKAQAKMKMADKDSTNPHYKSKYADLASVWDACRDALTSEGLSIVQGIQEDGIPGAPIYVLETKLMHSSGEYIDSYTPLFMPPSPNMQHLGAAVTYAKRISLMAIAGISVGEVDDDGEENRKAMEAAPPKQPSDAEEFAKHLRELREYVRSKGLQDDVLNFGRVRAAEEQVNGLAMLRLWSLNKDVFEKEYAQYLRAKNG